ncbi:KAP family NTPase [Kerstersia gyiorum]|uniref:KAP family P-loop NTPase fold protein n=1 Tax=Kerstersia gyiorum TaxID=206506 RepID=UPI00214FAFAF|nr:KAP family NTPase [Kerstersia gyiorum]MCR4158017.1 KAP family NTPase [Kerstersia gyiorum]
MKTSQSKIQVSDTDRPLDDPEKDELGFVEMAAKLAPAVLNSLDTDGIVIGIEGEWGSGKTTLANYLLKEVQEQAGSPIEVIYISPWLSGDSDTLVGSLLQAIAVAIEEKYVIADLFENKKSLSWMIRWQYQFRRGRRWINKKKQTQFMKLLAKYVRKTARTASPLLTAGEVLLPGTGIAAGKALDAGANAFENLTESATTATLKKQIASQLKMVNCRFIVLIDDLDRLEPALAVEVVRLVRSVADFPNILYIMCYDRAVLAHALEVGLNVTDGYRFLRKIVQQTFSIPLPEPFDLRLALADKAISFFGNFHHRIPTETESNEIRSAINEWGYSLRTPRDVKLVMNAISFSYPPVSDNVYYPDMCRLQLIKVIHPSVYEWLEGYLSEYSVMVTGDGRIGRKERDLTAKRLLKIFPDKDDPESSRSPWRIQQLVPGVDMAALAKRHEFVFQGIYERTLVELSKEKRLGSPYHYRYYFALSGPRTVLSDTDLNTLLFAAKTGAAPTYKALAELYARPRRLGGNWLSQLFDRINKTFVTSLDGQQLESLLPGIADLMDDALRREPNGRMFRSTLADSASTVIGRLYREWRNREQDCADEAMIKLITTTSSVNWLVGEFFRTELFSHGLVDPSRARPEEQWLLPETVFERALPIVKRRAVEHAEKTAIHQFPDLPGFVFGWRNLSDNEIVRGWVSRQIKTDEGFVDFLLLMRGWTVSDRVYRHLRRKSLVDLMDVDLIQQRLEQIHENEKKLAHRVREVMDALKWGDDL